MGCVATVLHPDGRKAVHSFDDDTPPLEWLEQMVGGEVERVPTLPGRVYVNEDATLIKSPPNRLAAEHYGDVPGTVDGMLRGVVVIVERS